MIKTTYKPLTDDQLPQAWEDWKQKHINVDDQGLQKVTMHNANLHPADLRNVDLQILTLRLAGVTLRSEEELTRRLTNGH